MDKRYVVGVMIEMYCRRYHGSRVICPFCQELLDYANNRINACSKSIACDSCKIHCYGTYMGDRIRAVMKYSGPRMILYHPILAIKHLIGKIKTRY